MVNQPDSSDSPTPSETLEALIARIRTEAKEAKTVSFSKPLVTKSQKSFFNRIRAEAEKAGTFDYVQHLLPSDEAYIPTNMQQRSALGKLAYAEWDDAELCGSSYKCCIFSTSQWNLPEQKLRALLGRKKLPVEGVNVKNIDAGRVEVWLPEGTWNVLQATFSAKALTFR